MSKKTIFLHCSRYSDAIAQLHDTVEGVYDFAKSGHSITDAVNFIIAPPCDNNTTKKEDIFVKEALLGSSPTLTGNYEAYICDYTIRKFTQKESYLIPVSSFLQLMDKVSLK